MTCPVAIRLLSLVLTAQIGPAAQDARTEAKLGLELAGAGKYELAIQHYKAALRLDSHLPELYLNLGLAYFKSERLSEAAAAFEQAVRVDGDSFQARTLLGMSYYGSARYADAAAQLKVAAAAQPDNVELRYTLAQSYLWSKQYPQALTEFQVLLARDPDSAPVHVLLGEALDASNQTDAAIAEFQAAVKAPFVPLETHFGLGYLYWKQRRYEEARREFEAELAGQPQHAQALTYLGDTEMHSERGQSAEVHLRRALTLDANIRLANLDMGVLLAARSESEEAARCFREAIRIEPSNPDAHYHLGRLWLSLGREQQAQAEFETVRKLAAEQPPPPLVQIPKPPNR